MSLLRLLNDRMPTISPLLTHCSKTSSDRDICKKEVRTAIAHCRAKAEAKRKRHCMSDIKGQRRSLWDRLRHKEHSKRRRATQAEDAVAPGTQPTLTATQAEGSMASGDVVAHFLPAAVRETLDLKPGAHIAPPRGVRVCKTKIQHGQHQLDITHRKRNDQVKLNKNTIL